MSDFEIVLDLLYKMQGWMAVGDEEGLTGDAVENALAAMHRIGSWYVTSPLNRETPVHAVDDVLE